MRPMGLCLMALALVLFTVAFVASWASWTIAQIECLGPGNWLKR